MVVRTYPSCPSCGRTFRPGAAWNGANYCRGAYLLPLIRANPGKSAAELAELSGMSYRDVSRALVKVREFGIFRTEAEDRGEQGGIRYRYYADEDPHATEAFMAIMRRAEKVGQ